MGKIYVINVLQINEYLYGVVPSEIISTWETEALKAQAVAARTYTYHHLISSKKNIYDLDNSSNFQVYNGISSEKENTTIAVNETSGQIMFYKGKPIVAFFHSTCGGRTSHDKYVWGGEGQEYLKSVACTYCKESPYFSWEEKVSLYEIKEFLNKKYRGVGNITGIVFQRKDNRVVSAVIHHKNGIVKLTGNELRLLFPEKKIKSMHFTAQKVNDGLILHGHGWGHGVGMCQWGAKGMAEKGAGYKDILRYYYKGVSIIGIGHRDYAWR
ncbi:MAG: SpoIID/LytB domain-containing protein [Spirochaetes bacterium]|nr:SpoIID/LytB domain-containing protein [Spirochaetota bacterium]